MIAAPPPATTAAPTEAPAPSPLAIFRGKSRVLLMSSPREGDAAVQRQMQAFNGVDDGVNSRDIVLVRLFGSTPSPSDPAVDPAAARRFAGLSPDRFGLALIGKDGHVALRSDRPLSAATIFQAIDAMPMRQEEMRRDGNRKGR